MKSAFFLVCLILSLGWNVDSQGAVTSAQAKGQISERYRCFIDGTELQMDGETEFYRRDATAGLAGNRFPFFNLKFGCKEVLDNGVLADAQSCFPRRDNSRFVVEYYFGHSSWSASMHDVGVRLVLPELNGAKVSLYSSEERNRFIGELSCVRR